MACDTKNFIPFKCIRWNEKKTLCKVWWTVENKRHSFPHIFFFIHSSFAFWIVRIWTYLIYKTVILRHTEKEKEKERVRHTINVRIGLRKHWYLQASEKKSVLKRIMIQTTYSIWWRKSIKCGIQNKIYTTKE